AQRVVRLPPPREERREPAGAARRLASGRVSFGQLFFARIKKTSSLTEGERTPLSFHRARMKGRAPARVPLPRFSILDRSTCYHSLLRSREHNPSTAPGVLTHARYSAATVALPAR